MFFFFATTGKTRWWPFKKNACLKHDGFAFWTWKLHPSFILCMTISDYNKVLAVHKNSKAMQPRTARPSIYPVFFILLSLPAGFHPGHPESYKQVETCWSSNKTVLYVLELQFFGLK